MYVKKTIVLLFLNEMLILYYTSTTYYDYNIPVRCVVPVDIIVLTQYVVVDL